MPTYQYTCTESACGHRFEAVQSFSDASLTSCPVCAGAVRKVFSAVGVVFKGSGFYRTDSRTDARASSNGSKSTSSESNGSESKSSESKSSESKSSESTAKSADSSSSSSKSSSSSSSSDKKSSSSTSSAATS